MSITILIRVKRTCRGPSFEELTTNIFSGAHAVDMVQLDRLMILLCWPFMSINVKRSFRRFIASFMTEVIRLLNCRRERCHLWDLKSFKRDFWREGWLNWKAKFKRLSGDFYFRLMTRRKWDQSFWLLIDSTSAWVRRKSGKIYYWHTRGADSVSYLTVHCWRDIKERPELLVQADSDKSF